MKNTFNFTEAAIKKLPLPKSSRQYYKDGKEKGLSLYITATGNITFFVRKRVHGKDERIILGNFPDLKVEQARKNALKTKATIADGKNPNEEKQKLSQDITFGEMFNQFMERYSKKFKRSWKYDEREVNKFLSHWFKKKSMQISNQEIRRLHESIYSENGLYQANRLLERIRAIYNKSIEWGWEGANPALGIKKYKEKSRDRFLQADELPHLFQALAEETNTIARDYILISLLTGARKSNVLSMRWSEVNLNNKTWRIPETKNGESLTLPLMDQAVDILLQRKKLNNDVAGNNNFFIFPGTGKDGHLADPKKSWKRICMSATIKLWKQDTSLETLFKTIKSKELYSISQIYKTITEAANKKSIELPIGLMDIRIHDLRRTLGSWQAATGATTAIIGKSLGHKSQQATAIYERLNIDPVRASVKRATDAMLGNSISGKHQ